MNNPKIFFSPENNYYTKFYFVNIFSKKSINFDA